MARGGARQGAGAKSTWNYGKTRTIRVPVVLAEELMRIARDMDEKGLLEYDTGSKLINLSAISVPQINGKKFVFLQDLFKSGYLIEPRSLANRVAEEVCKSQAISNQKQGGLTKAGS